MHVPLAPPARWIIDGMTVARDLAPLRGTSAAGPTVTLYNQTSLAPAPTMAEILTLVIVTLLAVAVPPLLRGLQLPLVVGELGVGILAAGASLLVYNTIGFTLLAEGEIVELLATLGVILLFFLIGLEIDFDLMESQGIRPILLGLGMLLANIVIAYGVLAGIMGYPPATAFFLTLVLSETSVAILYPALKDSGITGTAYGQSVLAYGLLIEFGVVILAGVFTLAYSPRSGFDVVSAEVLLLLPALALAFWAIYKLGGWAMWRFPRAVNRFFVSDDPAEMGVRTALALMFIFAALTETLGTEAILGGLFAGVVVSLLFRDTGFLERKLFGIGYGFLIPIFFISAGLGFDFGVFSDTQSLLLIPIFLAIVLAGKLLPVAVLVPDWGGQRSLAAGWLLTSRLTLSVAVASVGLDLNLISSSEYSAILLLALILAVASPLLFRRTFPGEQTGTEEPTPGGVSS